MNVACELNEARRKILVSSQSIMKEAPSSDVNEGDRSKDLFSIRKSTDDLKSSFKRRRESEDSIGESDDCTDSESLNKSIRLS